MSLKSRFITELREKREAVRFRFGLAFLMNSVVSKVDG